MILITGLTASLKILSNEGIETGFFKSKEINILALESNSRIIGRTDFSKGNSK